MNKFLKISFYAILVLFGFWLILSEWMLQDRWEREQTFVLLQDGWYQRDTCGNVVEVTFPGQAPVLTEDQENGVYRMSVERVLPKKIPQHGYVCLRAPQQDVQIYIEEELRLSYSTDTVRLYGKNTDSCYLYLPLAEEDTGKVLRIETESTLKEYAGVLRELYCGTQADIISYILRDNAFVLIIILILMLFGILAMVMTIVSSVCLKKKVSIGYLGWFDVVIAFWLLCETNVIELFFPDLLMIQTVPDIILMLCTIPMLFYINEQQQKRYAFRHQAMILFAIIVTVVCTLLHVFNILDYYETMPVTAIVVVCNILGAGYTFIEDIRRGHGKEMNELIFGCLCCALLGMIELLNTFVHPGAALGGYLAIGMLIQLLCAAVRLIVTSFRDERARQAAIQANQEKTDFLMRMSHDIRTPLNTILGMNEMILREDSSQEIQSYACNIENAGQYLLSLLSDLMDISQIETGNLKLKEIEYDVRSMLQNLMTMVQIKKDKKKVEFHTDIDYSLPSRLCGDMVHLEQAIGNLLTNAIKYTEKGCVTLRIRKESVEGEFISIMVSVEDTGCGIRPEDMERLFRSYERLEQEHNSKVEGYGLGLAIASQLVRLMGGEIKVESEYGKGSCFFFLLRQRIVDQSPIGSAQQELIWMEDNVIRHMMAPDATILVVDDNEMNRVIMKKLLQPTRMRVDTASSGAECLQAVCRRRYDLILMDDMMPELNGTETLHAMEQKKGNLCKNTPVVMLTANAVDGVREYYLAEGFCDYLAKPVAPKQLEKLLQQHISKNLQESYCSIKGINLDMGMMYCGDSQEIYREVMEVFCEMGETMPERMEELYQKKDWSAYQIQVHSLKSSAMNIGAKELSCHAKELERAVKTNDIETVTEFHGKIMEEYRELLKNTGVYLKG